MRPALVVGFVAVTIAIVCAAGQTPRPERATRSFRMGFSHIPPRQSIPDVIKTIDSFSSRADGAIDHRDVPWRRLMDGGTMDAYIEKDVRGLYDYYHNKKLDIVIMVEPFDGLDRTKESPVLLKMGRSVSQPEVQKAYLDFVEAMARTYKPRYMGLASEVNVLLATLSPGARQGLLHMTAEAAKRVHKVSPDTKVYVSMQVEYAWGRLAERVAYRGCDEAFKAFPWMQAIGLSSYPFFAYDEPDEVPSDYFARIVNARKLPVLLDEGGWSTATVDKYRGSEARQSAWIARVCDMMQGCGGVFVGQLTFTDLDIPNIAGAGNTILPLFANLGLVDKQWSPKPALKVWDSHFSRPLREGN